MKLSVRHWLAAALLPGLWFFRPGAHAASPPAVASPLYPASPAELYGALFEQVQMRRVFAESTIFVDATPKRPAAEILRDYLAGAAAGKFAKVEALRSFVLANFTLAEEAEAILPQSSSGVTTAVVDASSLLELPASDLLTGARAGEVYYWDSYFTLLGAKADGQQQLVDSTVDHFVLLVERFGHVPSGNRSYYLSRSQPPFLYLMVELAAATNRETQRRRLQALRMEHAFWMSGSRVVAMPDGTPLNRYWDERATPREEAFREDNLLVNGSPRAAAQVWRDVRAAAESGWTFSSRWLADGKNLGTIETTNVVPVDLNSLLYGLERSIAAQCRAAHNRACTERFEALAERRRSAIERYLWDPVSGYYTDWDLRLARPRAALTAAALFPLFTGVASPEHGHAMARVTEKQLLAPGGLRTTLVKTGQPWDAPNGWAPLQWVAFDGLRRYEESVLAQSIGERYVANVKRGVATTGKLLEQYNVETPGTGDGGEYRLYEGFSWTDGIVRALLGAGVNPPPATKH
jgi:alpha,alpha-trehalase